MQVTCFFSSFFLLLSWPTDVAGHCTYDSWHQRSAWLHGINAGIFILSRLHLILCNRALRAYVDLGQRKDWIMTYLGEAVIDGTLFSVFMTDDGRVVYLP